MGVLGVSLLAAALVSAEGPRTSLLDATPMQEEAAHPSSHNPYLMTVLETSVLLGLGTLWYWRSPSLTDRDLGFNWKSWKGKLFSTDDVVFDSNLFDTNVVAHPRAGLGYYQIARGNGFGFGASFLSAFLASTAWEYMVEFIEKPSLNDMIVTPVAGTVIGEATYQVGRYFASGPPTAVNQIGALLFSPVATLNSWAAGRDKARAGMGGGFRGWHRFELTAGAGHSAFSTGSGRDDVILSVGDRLVSNRAYLRSGAGAEPVAPGEWTEIATRLLLDDGKASGVDFHADVVVWGRYLRNYADSGHAETSGWGVLAGVSSGFDYDSRTLPNFRDRTASVGVLGPTLEIDRRRGGLRLRATAASRWGLALVQSLAYPSYAADLNGTIIKSPLRAQGYYYAHGLFSTVGLGLEYGSVELALAARLDTFWSIDARDRIQSQLQDDFSLSDQRATVAATLATRPWPGPFRVVTGIERVARRGHLIDRTVTSDETRATVAAAVTF